jgi:hypothetical protein
MRAKFELCAKVVGLVLFCSGAIAVFLAIPSWLHRLDPEALYPASVVQGSVGDQLRSQMRAATSLQGRWIAVHLLLCGAIPMVLGICLMRFSGPVARFCYPEPDCVVATGPSAGGLDLKIKADSQGSKPSKASGEQKYAPPGYFKPEG